MTERKRIHITIPGDVYEGLSALGELEDRDVSEILVQLAREDLIKRGHLEPITGAILKKHIAKRRGK